MDKEQHKAIITDNLKGKGAIKRTHHLSCNGAICRTVQVDLSNHLISFMTIVDGVSISRQTFSYKEFADATQWVIDVTDPPESANETKVA